MTKVNLANGKVTVTADKPIPKVEPPGRRLPNWLEAYGEFVCENEAPEVFHLWVGIGTLAGAARRRIQLSSAYFDVHSNFYIVLVAPPGTCRKTTALRVGQGILKGVPGIHFTTKATSPAALIQQLGAVPEKEHQSLTSFAYELGTMLASDTATMIDLLADLWDCEPDFDKQTIGRGYEKIPRPWLNIIGATTPRWIGDHLSSTAVEGGLIARTIFIYADKRKHLNAFPEMTPRMVQLKKDLINDLVHISTLSGEFLFSAEGKQWYKDWYNDMSRFPEFPDDRTASYYDRKHVLLLKTAMMISLAEKDELVLEERDLRTALALLDGIEPGMRKAFSAMGKNTYATDLERIAKQIHGKPEGLSIGPITTMNYHALDRSTIEEILMQLQSMGRIRLTAKGIYQGIPGQDGDLR